MQQRIQQIPSNRLVSTLKQLQRNQDKLKTAQFTSGRSGLINYLTQTTSTWDSTGSASHTAFAPNIIFTLTYTSDGSQPYPIALPYADLFINSVDEAHRLSVEQWKLTIGSNLVFLGEFADSGDYVNFLALNPTYALNPTTYQWTAEVTTTATSAVTYFFKAYVRGTCPGTLSVSTVVQ